MKPKIANKVIEKVRIRLDGREWPLVVTHNVLCDLEELLPGVNVLFGAESIARPNARIIRALLYLCLREQGADYTLEQAGALITAQNLAVVTKGVIEAWVASMPTKEDVENEAGELKAVS